MKASEIEMCSRFKELRKTLNIKQGDFAKELAISQGHASDIENGRKSVSDRIIEILSLKYNINEEWLKSGTGEMFRKPSDEIGYYVEDLLEYKGGGNPFYDMIIEMMKTYHELDEKSKTVIREYFRNVKNGLKEKEEV